MANEVVIKISGDAKNFQDALGKIEKTTEGLRDSLSGVAKTAGVAFAALTAEIGLSVSAYAEAEKVTNELTRSMQNQGVYSKALIDSYKQQATEIQNLTGISDEAVQTAQGTIQAYIGQNKVTKELTLAIADFAAAQGIDLASAANLVGKSIGTGTNALTRYGIEVDTTATKQEKMSKIMEQLNARFGGQAEAAASGTTGSITKLKEAFGDLQEVIGERFAPIIKTVADRLTSFLQFIQQNKALSDFLVSVIAAGAALTGIVTVVAAGGLAFLKLKAALEAAKVATTAMSIATKGLVGATGIGLLLIVATEIYLNWNSIWPRMQATFQAFVNNIGKLGEGLSQILKGVFTFDKDMIKKGLDASKNAFVTGYDEYGKIVDEKMKEQAAKENQTEQDKVDMNREIQKTAAQKQLEDREEAYQATLEQNEEFQALDDEQKQIFKEENDAKNIEAQETERTAAIAFAQQKLQEKQKADKLYLADQQKFGAAYAEINKIMHSEIYAGTKQAGAELASLTQSNNATLKAIGKAAAVANIVIKTAESAMNIYAGFSTIPIVGIPLGIAGAAAAVAFGGEQVGRVLAAAQGGLMTGGIPGRDSIPVLAQQGELMAPVQNFDEVIGSVRAAREAQSLRESGLAPGAGGGQVTVQILLDKDASQVFTAKQVEDRALGIAPESVGSA